MDWKIVGIIGGSILAFIGGVVALQSKLVKKADKPEKEQEVKDEKKFAGWTFIITVILAQALTLSSGILTWNSDQSSKEKADSTARANQELSKDIKLKTDTIQLTQDSLNKLVIIQLDSTKSVLNVSLALVDSQKKVINSALELKELAKETQNQITGGGSTPFLVMNYGFYPKRNPDRLAVTTYDSNFIITRFAIKNSGIYPLHNVQIEMRENESLLTQHELGIKFMKTNDQFEIIYDTPINLDTVKHFSHVQNFQQVLKGAPEGFYIGTILNPKDKSIEPFFYAVYVRWNTGSQNSFTYYITGYLKEGKVRVEKVSVIDNDTDKQLISNKYFAFKGFNLSWWGDKY